MTAKPITIELVGTFVPPTAYPEMNNMPVPTVHTILYAKTPASGVYPAVIAGPSGANAWTNITFVMKNITVRQPNNPSLQGLQLFHVANCDIENVVCDVDATITEGVAQPTHEVATALILPDRYNYGFVRVRNFYAVGYYGGIQFCEHADLDNVFLQRCYKAFLPDPMDHIAYFGKVLVQQCPYVIVDIFASGKSYLKADMIDIEDAPTGAYWYQAVNHIYDPNNLIYANIGIHRVIGGIGATTGALTNNGAANVTTSII